MSADTSAGEEGAASDEVEQRPRSSATDLEARVAELESRLESLDAADEADDEKSMTIIATKGSLDMAYPPLILASTAAAFGWDVTVFHTFWGLDILHEERSKNLKLSAVGNPSMPMPNAVAALPGMDSVATRMMEKRIDENGTASVEELIDVSLDMGVELQACEMTTDLMEYDHDDFYDGVRTDVGAATALRHMADADIQLLV
ncbi:MAG: DsrE/DsrF/DrsH-like family protein [Halosimplex sp.]